ncbi:MAG: hypothetical protein A2X14_01480 [Bacteroidetes bacterium GWD2_33_33]|nr:MAG: hypothetical protein A2X14_01480 [Bacteroidetes bacterium GWD2_33_33]
MKKQYSKFLLISTLTLLIFLILLSFRNINYINQNPNKEQEQIADSLMNLGYSFYNTEPLKFINFLDSAARLYDIAECLKKQALCYQNIAFVYQEKLQNFNKAEEFTLKSISNWREINDTLNEANLLKYLGAIQGELGKYDIAKSNIKCAINKFRLKQFNAGIAVSYYDLALVYEKEERSDSCIHFLNLNKKFFEAKNDTFRIFNVNNKLLYTYIKTNNFEQIEQLINSNLSFQVSQRVRWNQKLDFYQFSNEYYTKIKNETLSNDYLNKYKTLKDSLIKEGVFTLDKFF